MKSTKMERQLQGESTLILTSLLSMVRTI